MQTILFISQSQQLPTGERSVKEKKKKKEDKGEGDAC